ncbi:MAG: hypothetical protein ACI9OE_000388 [Mariniflexile sp.]|jgi:hypothetical protein
MYKEENFRKQIKKVYLLILVLFSLFLMTGGMLVYYTINPDFFAFITEPETMALAPEVNEDRIENGIHIRTGFIEAEGLMTVINNCTNCHSSKLVIQNRMNTERWNATIKWMQETQNLWDLGKNQEIIVNYLVSNYPPTDKGRRETLSNIEWYELKD